MSQNFHGHPFSYPGDARVAADPGHTHYVGADPALAYVDEAAAVPPHVEEAARALDDGKLRAEIRRAQRLDDLADGGTVAVEPPALEASMDGAGNVTMRATLGPEDRRVLREVALDQAKAAADNLGHRRGLLSLFPTNRQTWRVRRTY